MQVTIMKFWIEQDFNFAFFFMQVIHMLFWGEIDYLHLLLHAVSIMMFWIEFDLVITFFCLQVIHMLFWGTWT